MKASFLPVSVLALLALTSGLSVRAQDVATSEIQGFVRLNAPSYTDTQVSPAFGRPAAWSGAVSSIESNRLHVSASANWTGNQFVPGTDQTDTFYVRILSGDDRGHFFTVAGNDAASLLLDNAGTDLTTSVHAGDRIEIAPYWTLGTFYPASQANVTFVPSPTPLLRQTEIYFYDPAGVGTSRPTAQSFYFYNGAWRKLGQPETVAYDTVVIMPDTYFQHRNKGGATAVVENGRVFDGAVSTFVTGLPTRAQDNYAAIAYPLSPTLRQTRLVESGAFGTSATAAGEGDTLLLFKPNANGYNHAIGATYFYYNGGWRKQGDAISTDYSDSASVPAAQGFVIRKPAGATSQAWTFETGL